MKYLKKYNESNYTQKDRVIDDVNDILLDLIDDGFKIDIRTEKFIRTKKINEKNPGEYCSFSIRLNTINQFERFNFSDIKETLFRLKSYSKDPDFNFNLYGNHEPIVVLMQHNPNFDEKNALTTTQGYVDLEKWDKYMARIFFKIELNDSKL